MNTSFDPLELVNTYGAFGSVGRERLNVVFEGTDADAPDAHAEWKEYPYQALPVKLNQRPRQIAPYQPRLDWQMWFAAMNTFENYPWTLHLVWKLLHNDPGDARACWPIIHFLKSRPVTSAPCSIATNSPRPATRTRLVEADRTGRMAPSACSGRPPAADVPRRPRLGQIKHGALQLQHESVHFAPLFNCPSSQARCFIRSFRNSLRPSVFQCRPARSLLNRYVRSVKAASRS